MRADYEAAAALCLRWGCGAGRLQGAARGKGGPLDCFNKGLSSAELATLGTLGSVLPSLEELSLGEPAAGPDGVQRLAERLGRRGRAAGRDFSFLDLGNMHVGDAGASALAAALGRGALRCRGSRPSG